MTASLYCEGCDINWPNGTVYVKCPGCAEKTTVLPGVVPLGPNVAMQLAADLALSRDRHAAFEAFCAHRDKPRIDAECEKFREELNAFTGVT